MKAVIIPDVFWYWFQVKIMDRIIETAGKGYGCKFISRETGEELPEEAVRGLFLVPIKQAMEEAERS